MTGSFATSRPVAAILSRGLRIQTLSFLRKFESDFDLTFARAKGPKSKGKILMEGTIGSSGRPVSKELQSNLMTLLAHRCFNERKTVLVKWSMADARTVERT